MCVASRDGTQGVMSAHRETHTCEGVDEGVFEVDKGTDVEGSLDDMGVLDVWVMTDVSLCAPLWRS